MNKLFKIKAQIEIHREGGRTLPIKTGYRPAFNFIDKKLTSGLINLLEAKELKPGEKSSVEVSFISDELLGNIKSGIEFKFYEGSVEIGKGKVLNVIGWKKP